MMVTLYIDCLYNQGQSKSIQMKFKKFLLKSYPTAQFPEDLSCFEIKHDAELDEHNVPQGFALVKIFWTSTDPLLRTWISGAKSYLEPVHPGSGVPGFGIGRVIKITHDPKRKTIIEDGDWITGMLEWSEYMLINYKRIQKLPLDLGKQQYKYLTVYGPTGFTSYWSIKKEIIPFQIINKQTNKIKSRAELNIVISSVAGGVGLTLTQYLNKLGYVNVYGIAGSDQKCKIAQQLGCKGTINYQKYYKQKQFMASAFEKDIKKMMNGEEIDLYYENVGEDMLSSMLKLMADHSKIVMCGATATYNNWREKMGVRNMQNIISKRIEMKGILYFEMESSERIGGYLEMASLNVKGAEVMIKGMENLPYVYRDMLNGKFIGKPIVQIVDCFGKE